MKWKGDPRGTPPPASTAKPRSPSRNNVKPIAAAMAPKPVVISPEHQKKRVAYAMKNPTYKPILKKQAVAGRVKAYKSAPK